MLSARTRVTHILLQKHTYLRQTLAKRRPPLCVQLEKSESFRLGQTGIYNLIISDAKREAPEKTVGRPGTRRADRKFKRPVMAVDWDSIGLQAARGWARGQGSRSVVSHRRTDRQTVLGMLFVICVNA